MKLRRPVSGQWGQLFIPQLSPEGAQVGGSPSQGNSISDAGSAPFSCPCPHPSPPWSPPKDCPIPCVSLVPKTSSDLPPSSEVVCRETSSPRSCSVCRLPAGLATNSWWTEAQPPLPCRGLWPDLQSRVLPLLQPLSAMRAPFPQGHWVTPSPLFLWLQSLSHTSYGLKRAPSACIFLSLSSLPLLLAVLNQAEAGPGNSQPAAVFHFDGSLFSLPKFWFLNCVPIDPASSVPVSLGKMTVPLWVMVKVTYTCRPAEGDSEFHQIGKRAPFLNIQQRHGQIYYGLLI